LFSRNDFDSVVRTFQLMQNDGIVPNIRTFQHLLLACETDRENGFGKAVMVCSTHLF
jgi:pentatricopeptide repeat protein